MLDSLELLQYNDETGWMFPDPTFEGALVIEHWFEAMPPEAVCWWAVGWNSGAVTYYRWVKMNPCSQVVLVHDSGPLPGPPGGEGVAGPPGPPTLIAGSVSTAAELPDPSTLAAGTGYIVEDSGDLYVATPDPPPAVPPHQHWVNAGQIVGPSGPTDFAQPCDYTTFTPANIAALKTALGLP